MAQPPDRAGLPPLREEFVWVRPEDLAPEDLIGLTVPPPVFLRSEEDPPRFPLAGSRLTFCPRRLSVGLPLLPRRELVLSSYLP